jgi:hypothetical protein
MQFLPGVGKSISVIIMKSGSYVGLDNWVSWMKSD